MSNLDFITKLTADNEVQVVLGKDGKLYHLKDYDESKGDRIITITPEQYLRDYRPGKDYVNYKNLSGNNDIINEISTEEDKTYPSNPFAVSGLSYEGDGFRLD